MPSPIWSLLGITQKQAEDIMKRIQEIKQLYNLSEAEMELVQQMAMLIKLGMNLSPELQLKCLKGLTALTESIMEATRHLKKDGE